jgi:hypothetical protein
MANIAIPMKESIDVLSHVLKNKLINFIARFPYFPSFELKTINNSNIEDILYILLQHIIKTDTNQYYGFIRAMSAHTHGIEWYSEQFISLLNMSEAIQKLNNNSKDTLPVVTGITNIITELSNRELWFI